MVGDVRNQFRCGGFRGGDTLGSRIGCDVLGFQVRAPFGLRDDVFHLILVRAVHWFGSLLHMCCPPIVWVGGPCPGQLPAWTVDGDSEARSLGVGSSLGLYYVTSYYE